MLPLNDPVAIVRRVPRFLAGFLTAALLAAGAPAGAQSVSARPDKVAVTIYRASDRGAEQPIERDWLQGYALVTEQRTVKIPAGRTTIRFEGVAAGILAESAIVSGLPQGVREKNLDAELLSPRNLFARSFGRPVTIRRTIRGKSVEERAIIRSGPDGAAIVQTKDGFEALNCGMSDALVYDGLPAGLAAKPTLSIEVDSPHAMQATITLSYLAWGFDWEANYVATMRPDGRSADLNAWVTLASSDTTSFPAAEAMVVAGKPKREDSAGYRRAGEVGGDVIFTCFTHPAIVSEGLARVMAMAAPSGGGSGDIVVTAMRRTVRQEDLGDLKLYRVPDRTTVAAMAQKQVALLERQAVPVQIVYVADLRNDDDFGTPMIVLRAANRKEQGLGLPLPAGRIVVFEPHHGEPLLVGEGFLPDKAVGENLDIKVAEATQVTIDTESDRPEEGDWRDYIATLRNANPYLVRFEIWLDADVAVRLMQTPPGLGRRDGHAVWAVDLPANGTRVLRYRLKDDD
ncbi:MAG: hypothetical protein ABI039_05325 [Vicinamibacterales bacterium]